MKRARNSPNMRRRWYRPVEQECPQCHRTLRQAMTLARRTVITLQGVIRLIHAGYRCPDVQCPGHERTYRSPAADALARVYEFIVGKRAVYLMLRRKVSINVCLEAVRRTGSISFQSTSHAQRLNRPGKRCEREFSSLRVRLFSACLPTTFSYTPISSQSSMTLLRECSVRSTETVSPRSILQHHISARILMMWKPAWSDSQKGRTCKRTLCPKARTLAGHCE